MPDLLLYFEAPLQSWGFESQFDLRTTASFPTLSGVAGILLAADGAEGPQETLLRSFVPERFVAYRFKKELTADHPLPLMDYHMVGSGYNRNDPWESRHIPRKADGKIASANGAPYGGAKQTFRYYLQSAKFAVTLTLDDALCTRFANALQNPVFDLYFGRKCCVPTDFIFRGVFNTPEETQAEICRLAEAKACIIDRVRRTVTPETEDAIPISDVPVAFGPNKRYAERYIRDEPWPPEN